MTRVLVAGGYGLVGAGIVRSLRAEWSDVEVVIGGRRPEAGAALAEECGATVARFDTADAEAGLAGIGPVDLVVAAVQDPDDAALRASLGSGAAYLGIVRKVGTVGPTAILAAHLARRPAMIMGHWQAGAATFAALATAREFDQVERVALAGLFDSADPVGPMSTDDSSSFFDRALQRVDGHWRYVAPGEGIRTVDRGDPAPYDAQPMGVLDVPAVVAATGARDVRFDIGIGESLGTLGGGTASHEIYADLWGKDADGGPLARRTVVSDPRGQGHLTAHAALIGVERVLGLDGRTPPRAGLVLPEGAIDPAGAVARLREFGITVSSEPLDARSQVVSGKSRLARGACLLDQADQADQAPGA